MFFFGFGFLIYFDFWVWICQLQFFLWNYETFILLRFVNSHFLVNFSSLSKSNSLYVWNPQKKTNWVSFFFFNFWSRSFFSILGTSNCIWVWEISSDFCGFFLIFGGFKLLGVLKVESFLGVFGILMILEN